MRKRVMGVIGDHENRSDRVRVHHKRERWGELTIEKRDGVRVHHEKERWGNFTIKKRG